MKTVMISGHFDPFHFAHLDYLKEASKLGNLICVISSDKQVVRKKGVVNEPEYERGEIVFLILKGLGISSQIITNRRDDDTTLVTESLREFRPDIFCRGSDKSIEDMPSDEKGVCDDLGIEIVHIKGRVAHGSDFDY